MFPLLLTLAALTAGAPIPDTPSDSLPTASELSSFIRTATTLFTTALVVSIGLALFFLGIVLATIWHCVRARWAGQDARLARARFADVEGEDDDDDEADEDFRLGGDGGVRRGGGGGRGRGRRGVGMIRNKIRGVRDRFRARRDGAAEGEDDEIELRGVGVAGEGGEERAAAAA